MKNAGVEFNTQCPGLDGTSVALPASGECLGITVAKVDPDTSGTSGGAATVTETYDLAIDFEDAGGQWAAYLVLSQKVKSADISLKNEVIVNGFNLSPQYLNNNY